MTATHHTARDERSIDDGKINLTNAYALSKLPEEEQPNYVDSAMTEAPGTFVPVVNGRVTELKKAKREGRKADSAEFTPQPIARKLGEVKAEFEQPKVAGQICKALKADSPESGFAAAVAWFLNMDPASQQAQVAKDKERKAKREAEQKRRKQEREEQKKKEAAEKAADITSL